MKKLLLVSILLLLIVGTVLAYSTTFSSNPIKSEKIKVVATFYPLAYLAEKIGGERVSVYTLIPYNVEVHNWQPSPSDIMTIENSDIIILNGAGLDWWFESEILPLINISGKIIVNTTEGLPLILHNNQYDPHTWLSPYMAKLQAEKILSALIKKDPLGEKYYKERFKEIESKLNEIDEKYLIELKNKKRDIIIVSHEAFGYLAERYGFKQIGIIGISAEEEPNPRLILEIIELMKKYNLTTLYFDPIYSDKYVKMIKNELENKLGINVNVLKIYLCLGPIDNKDYFEQLEENLESLKKGLVE
ncbi:MAG: zinc ABC transporter substrate-binding protein [Candidatus Verstraetearchaeota archaeon]|nr:zinc ABC transporter substrate-binding protein [Candidatus Verstraetearchaeota archaeon]